MMLMPIPFPETTAARKLVRSIALLAIAAFSALACVTPLPTPVSEPLPPVSLGPPLPPPPIFDKRQWSSLSREGHEAVRLRHYSAAESSFMAALGLTSALPPHDARIQASFGNLVRLAASYHRRGREPDAERVMALVLRTEERRDLRRYAKLSHLSRYHSLIATPGSRLREAMRRTPSRGARAAGGGHPLDPLIARTARRYDVHPALVKAVVAAESNFDAGAVSHAGAQGLMQLMPATARQMGVQAPFEPDQNLRGGTRYLRKMLDRYGNLAFALAAYNAGPEAVDRYAGIPPFPETEAYVLKVMGLYRGFRGHFVGGGGAAPRRTGQFAPPNS